MGKSRQLSLDLWPLIDVILFSHIELIFRGGVSCLPAALLFNSKFAWAYHFFSSDMNKMVNSKENDIQLKITYAHFHQMDVA